MVSKYSKGMAVMGTIVRTTRKKQPIGIVFIDPQGPFFKQIRNLSNSTWGRIQKVMYLPNEVQPYLRARVEEGLLEDPENILNDTQLVIGYDGKEGRLVVTNNTQADSALQKRLPNQDVVKFWKNKGYGVYFDSTLAEGVYNTTLIQSGILPDEVDIPVKMSLFPHQIRNVTYALSSKGFNVFDEPGVGKTPTGVAAGIMYLSKELVDKVVIICPNTLKLNWKEEIERFSGDTSITVIGGATKKQRLQRYKEAEKSRWVVLNYDILSLDVDEITTLVQDSYLIADEVHRCKSWSAKRTKYLQKYGKLAAGRLGLTGTPIENNPSELYEILQFSNPGAFGERFSFLKKYLKPNAFTQYGEPRAYMLPEMARIAKFFYTRNLMSEVRPDLPELTVQHIPLEITDQKLQDLFRMLHIQAKQELEAASGSKRLEKIVERNTSNNKKEAELLLALLKQDPKILTYEDERLLDSISEPALKAGVELEPLFEFITRIKKLAKTEATLVYGTMLKQACVSPKLLIESTSDSAAALVKAGLVPDVDGPKIEILLDLLTELSQNNQRAVVFSTYKKAIDLIIPKLQAAGITYVRYTGDEDTEERKLAEKRFSDPNDNVTAFLATDAGAEGLNLGKQCNLLINLDLTYTATRMIQRYRRIRRIDGIHDSYRVINFTIENTVENKILKKIEQKAELMDTLLIEGESSGVTGELTNLNGDLFKESLKEFEIKNQPPRG